MALVSSADFDSLPLEPVARWLKLRDLLETRLQNVTDERNGVSDEALDEYCTVLVSAAEELALGKFQVFSVTNVREDYARIRSEIIALATKLSIRGATANAACSVALPRSSRAKIIDQIDHLRSIIERSELATKQKEKLFAKLDELDSIIRSPRTDFAKLMMILAAIAAVTSFLADAPQALATISAVIGEAKEDEEDGQRLLQASQEPLKLADLRDGVANDDEIPF